MRFDERAHSYDQHAVPQKLFAKQVAGFIQAPAGTAVLELGAGTGALTNYLCQAGFQVQATDASVQMVSIGRQSVPQAGWTVLDAFKNPVPPAPLQLSSGLLQWAPDPGSLLRSWAAAIKPGGRMVHAFACDPCLKEWRTLVPEGPIHWRTEREWTALFTAAGLRILRRELWLEEIVFPSSLDLAQSLHGSGVTGSPRLGTAQLRSALRTYNERFRTPGGVRSTWAWLAIEAI